MERVVRERMTTQDVEAITPQTLINIRPVVASIKEFFGTVAAVAVHGPDQPAGRADPQAAALGPRARAASRASAPGSRSGTCTRSHYGRMCPIETPEGPNIGLMGSLSTYGRINPFGFIETPYRRVTGGKVTDKIDYLSADEEDLHVIAQANAAAQARRHVRRATTVLVRRKGGEVDQSCRERGRLHGRVAQADHLGRRRADPVPGARRRQPGPDGRQHAAPGRPAAPLRGAARRHRGGVPRGRRRRGRRPRRGGGRGRGGLGRRRHGPRADRRAPQLQAPEVPPVQPGHLAQPEAAGDRGRPDRPQPGDRRRSLHRGRRARPRPQPHRRVHAVGGPQLRGRDHHLGAPRQGRRPHLDPHRGARGRCPRHEARGRGDHPGHPERLRGDPEGPRRARDRPDRRRGQPGRLPRGQGHAEGRDGAHAGGASAPGDLRREGARGARHLAQGAARRVAAR